jgi:hypothetical protein
MVESPREAAGAGVCYTAYAGKRDSKSPRRPLCRKGGRMTSNRCFADVPAGPKRNSSGRYLHQRGAYSGGRRTTNCEGFLGAIHSQAVKVATHGNVSGQRPPPSPVQSYRGIFWFFFFFKTHKGGGERGGDRLTPTHVLGQVAGTEQGKKSRVDRLGNFAHTWFGRLGIFFTLLPILIVPPPLPIVGCSLCLLYL